MMMDGSAQRAAAHESGAHDPGAGPRWVEAVPLDRLAGEGRCVARIGGRQILLIRAGDDLYACDNRCPHEGYPLMQGSLGEGCVLTCNWHNWKFDLASGETLVGGDRLRRYPVEARGGTVWVDIADPPAAERMARALDNLRDSFRRYDYERMAREIARLRQAGGDPLEALRQAIAWTHDRFEFGMTHALAAAPDWLALRARAAPDAASALVAVLEPVSHLAWDSLRWPRFPYPEGVAAFDGEALTAAIEAEDEAAAVAQIRGALQAGAINGLDRAISRAAAAHYQDFGHSMIYAYKARQLVEHLGPAVAAPVYLALGRSLVFATREDLIPRFRRYRPARATWDGTGSAEPDAARFRHAGIRTALAAALESSGRVEALYDALLSAAAWQMLHMDEEYGQAWDNPVDDNVNWLDFTHAITFANAGRKQAERHPEIWPDVLLQMACFTGRNAGYVDDGLDGDGWSAASPGAFIDAALAGLFDHGQFEHIVSCHHLKLLTAVREEIAERPDAAQAGLLAAAVHRFRSSPLKRKHSKRTAHQALSFVAEGG